MKGSIPKKAPWKTLVLSKQPFMGCALSTTTSGTERERGFVGNFLSCAELLSKCSLNNYKLFFLKFNSIHYTPE